MTTDRFEWSVVEDGRGTANIATWNAGLAGREMSLEFQITEQQVHAIAAMFGVPPAQVGAPGETVASIDAAVEGRCAGPGCGQILTEHSASAYFCGATCQEVWNRQRADRPEQVRGSTEVAPGPARWRPELESNLDAFDATGLELVRIEEVRGLTRQWYRGTDSDNWWFRLDDGYRFVGVDVTAEIVGEWEASDQVWSRLERELTDPRRLDPEPGTSDGVGAPREGWPPPVGLTPEQVRATICEWLRVNGIDPDLVPVDGQIEVRDGLIYCEVVQQGAPGGSLHRRQVVVRHRCRPPWPGTGPCPNCVERCEPRCGCTCWGVSTEEASSAFAALGRRLQEAQEIQEGERAVLSGGTDPRAEGTVFWTLDQPPPEVSARAVTVDPGNQAAGAVFWLADPPADPEAPAPAELAGGIELGTTSAAWEGVRPTATWVDETQRSAAWEAFRRAGEQFVEAGAASVAAYRSLPSATQRAIHAAVEAEQDRLTLRAVCADEAMYERALAEAQQRGWSVRSMAEAVASGRYTERGWEPEQSPTALDHLVESASSDMAGIVTTVPPSLTGADIMADLLATCRQLEASGHNPPVRLDASPAAAEALRSQAAPSPQPLNPVDRLFGVPIIPDPSMPPEAWRLEYADGQRFESHVCLWEWDERRSQPGEEPVFRCCLHWSDGTRCDSTTIDPYDVRRTDRLTGGSS